MLYESLDDIPRDCEVPYERTCEDEGKSYPQASYPDHHEPYYDLPESNLKDFLDWD